MMKHLKKLHFTVTATLLLLLIVTGGSSAQLLFPSIPVGQEEPELTPLPEEPGIQPQADEDDKEIDITKTF